jgi:hypothetical protein
MDGLSGMIVIEAADGTEDPVQKIMNGAFAYDPELDQPMTIMGWAHEQSAELAVRYLNRGHSYTQKIFENRSQRSALEPVYVQNTFLADYPWPITHVLINGRGQTKCDFSGESGSQTCNEVRKYGWKGTDSYISDAVSFAGRKRTVS